MQARQQLKQEGTQQLGRQQLGTQQLGPQKLEQLSADQQDSSPIVYTESLHGVGVRDWEFAALQKPGARRHYRIIALCANFFTSLVAACGDNTAMS